MEWRGNNNDIMIDLRGSIEPSPLPAVYIYQLSLLSTSLHLPLPRYSPSMLSLYF